MGTESGSIRVLHVDDEPEFLDLAAEYIEREDSDITVATASDANDGLEKLADESYDCIISDYDMPGLDGIGFLEAVREEYADIPFILFTGKGSEEVASDAITAGVTDYLQKSAGTGQYELLVNRIHNAVERYRAQEAIETSERQLRQVYERITDGFFAVNSDWEYVYANEEGAKLIDRPADELMGNTVWEVFPDLIDSPFEEPLRTAMEEQDTAAVEAFYPSHDSWYDVRVYGDDEGISIYFRDVTDEKERQQELNLMEQIVEKMNDGVVIAQDGVIKYTNPSITELMGAPADEFIGESMVEFIAPEFRDTVRERHRTRIDGESGDPPEIYEIAVETTTGERIPVEINVAEIEYRGDPATLSLVRDVTERQQREEELRRLKEEFETVFETAQDAIFLFDVDQENEDYEFRLRRLNPAHEATSGLSTEADQGKTPRELLGEETGAEVAARYRQCVESGEPMAYEEVLEMPGGTIHWHTILGPVFEDGKVTQIVGVARDITDRKRHEQRLTELVRRSGNLIDTETREETARAAVDIAREVLDAQMAGVHLVSDDGQRLEAAATMDAVGEELGIQPTYAKSDDSTASDITWEVYTRGESIFVEDTDEYGSLAEETPAQSGIIQPLGNHGVLIISSTEAEAFDETDVTLAELAAHILTATLDRVEREGRLERELDRLDKFASIVSHDLRNPLNVAQGRLELAAETCDSEDLDAVAQAHERMAELIEDTLRLARAGEIVGDPEVVDLSNLAEECWLTVESGPAEIAIETDLAIRADASRLRQLLENLFRNAIEHGGDDVTIRVGDLHDGFFVEDDGVGIPEEKRTQIQESDFSPSDPGVGFGLSIVRDIVEAHGWALNITTGPEGGARIEITGVQSE